MPLYSHEFQREVLYLLSNNVVFATNYGTYLSEDSFDLAPMKAIYTLVNQHMLTYEVELEKKDLLILVEDYINERGWGSESLKIFKEEVKDIYISKPKNEDFVADKVIQFVRRQALKKALDDSITILEKSEDLEDVLTLVDKAVSIGTGMQDTRTIKDLVHLPDIYRQIYDPSKLIKTGFSRYDNALQGGMAPGELHIFIGPPGSGKSTFGCNIGAWNLMVGKKVFHATLEIKSLDVLKHYALRLSGLSHTSFLTVDRDTWNKKMEKVRKLEDNLFVSYWPEKTANTLTLRAWIAQYRSNLKIHPDLIIVDYDDCLIPVGSTGREDMYEEGGNIYSDLIKLAEYFKCFPGDMDIMSNGLRVPFNRLKKNDIIPIQCIQNGILRQVSAIALGQLGTADKLMKIQVDDGGIQVDYGGIIRCTPDHKIMYFDGRMVEAKDVKVGDQLMAVCSYANYYKSMKKVISVETEILPEPIPVYCLHVPVIGNFALGNGVVVSNCPVITFAQPRRDAWNKAERDEIITQEDLAHSAKKAHKAYSVSSLNFKKGGERGKLYIDKCRRGRSNVYVDMKRDLTKSFFGENHEVLYDDEGIDENAVDNND